MFVANENLWYHHKFIKPKHSECNTTNACEEKQESTASKLYVNNKHTILICFYLQTSGEKEVEDISKADKYRAYSSWFSNSSNITNSSYTGLSRLTLYDSFKQIRVIFRDTNNNC